MGKIPFVKEKKGRLVKISHFNGKRVKARMLVCDLVGEYLIPKKKGDKKLKKISIFNFQGPHYLDIEQDNPFSYKFEFIMYEMRRSEGFKEIKRGIMDMVELNKITSFDKKIK